MIHSVLIFNTQAGKPRLTKHYTNHTQKYSLQKQIQQHIITTTTTTNLIQLKNNTIAVYRNYATLSFVFIIDNTESELAILDLIQVLVQSLDKCFKNVCELDLIFNYDKLDLLINQIILGGIVLDTSLDSITHNYQQQLNMLNNSN